MSKRKFYLISFLLVTILFFTSAVTCNFCGTPVEIITQEEETAEEQDARHEEDVTQESLDTSESQSSQSTPAESESDNITENDPPEIILIEINGYEIDMLIDEGLFDALPISEADYPEGVDFRVLATDSENDELEYRVYDSRGNEFEVTKINNNSAECTWYIPSETGPYTLTLEVSDGKGGSDSRSVDMNLVLESYDFILPEE